MGTPIGHETMAYSSILVNRPATSRANDGHGRLGLLRRFHR